MVNCLIVGDGSSDAILRYVLAWLLDDLYPDLVFNIEFADLRPYNRPVKGLTARIEKAMELYDCDVLFVHRDAENVLMETRLQEIAAAVAQLSGSVPPHVAIVPVRMTEAWLLIDEQAIREGANNPNGRTAIELPTPTRLHTIPNPKARLEGLLMTAANLNRRRLKKFKPRKQMYRVAEMIKDFSALRAQASFLHLEEQLKALASLPLFQPDELPLDEQ